MKIFLPLFKLEGRGGGGGGARVDFDLFITLKALRQYSPNFAEIDPYLELCGISHMIRYYHVASKTFLIDKRFDKLAKPPLPSSPQEIKKAGLKDDQRLTIKRFQAA